MRRVLLLSLFVLATAARGAGFVPAPAGIVSAAPLAQPPAHLLHVGGRTQRPQARRVVRQLLVAEVGVGVGAVKSTSQGLGKGWSFQSIAKPLSINAGRRSSEWPAATRAAGGSNRLLTPQDTPSITLPETLRNNTSSALLVNSIFPIAHCLSFIKSGTPASEETNSKSGARP